MGHKVCTKCRLSKPIEDFSKQGKYRMSACKECKKLILKEYYNRNKQYFSGYYQTRKKEHKEVEQKEIIDKEEIVKLCSVCRINKPLDQFTKRSGYENKYHSACKLCSNNRKRAKYQGRDKDRDRGTRHLLRESKSVYITSFLMKSRCVDCAETDISVLQFDHNNPNDKKFSLGSYYLHTLEEIKEEINKCTVRCGNCHKKKTAKDRNYFSVRMENGKYREEMLRLWCDKVDRQFPSERDKKKGILQRMYKFAMEQLLSIKESEKS